MKIIYTIVLVFCFCACALSQGAQATIRKSTSNESCVDIYAKSSSDVNDPPLNYVMSLSVPDQSPNPNPTIAVEDGSLLSGMKLDDNNPASFISGGRLYIDLNIVQDGNPPSLSWVAGTEYLIGTFCFNGADAGVDELVQMNDLSSFGSNGFTTWYFQVQGSDDDITDYTAKFYDDSGTTSTATIGVDSQVETVEQVLLPVILKSFSAEKHTKSSTMVRWTSSSEINASHYEVERSTDQSNWTFVGKVAAVGNSAVDQDYEYVDRDINLTSRDDKKIYYYRLRMVDLDGAAEYSPIDAVSFDALKVSGLFVYPNPTVEDVYITLDNKEAAQLRVADRNGKVVLTQQIVTGTDERVALRGLQSGVYMLTVIQNGEVLETQKVIKMD